MGFSKLIKRGAINQHSFVCSLWEDDILYIISRMSLFFTTNFVNSLSDFFLVKLKLNTVSIYEVFIVSKLLPLILKLQFLDILFIVGDVYGFYEVRVLLNTKVVFFANDGSINKIQDAAFILIHSTSLGSSVKRFIKFFSLFISNAWVKPVIEVGGTSLSYLFRVPIISWRNVKVFNSFLNREGLEFLFTDDYFRLLFKDRYKGFRWVRINYLLQ